MQYFILCIAIFLPLQAVHAKCTCFVADFEDIYECRLKERHSAFYSAAYDDVQEITVEYLGEIADPKGCPQRLQIAGADAQRLGMTSVRMPWCGRFFLKPGKGIVLAVGKSKLDGDWRLACSNKKF